MVRDISRLYHAKSAKLTSYTYVPRKQLDPLMLRRCQSGIICNIIVLYSYVRNS